MALALKLVIRGKFHLIGDAYEQAIPIAQTRIVQRKARQLHKSLSNAVSRRLSGQNLSKAIRVGMPRQPRLDPMATVWSKLYRRPKDTGGLYDVVNIFEQTRQVKPRTSLYIPTEAARRMSGERWRRNVKPEMFRGEMAFLPSNPRGGRRRGRRRRGEKGVMIHRRTKDVLFVVTGPVRLRRRFQPFARTAENQGRNIGELIANELDREVAKRLRRVGA